MIARRAGRAGPSMDTFRAIRSGIAGLFWERPSPAIFQQGRPSRLPRQDCRARQDGDGAKFHRVPWPRSADGRREEEINRDEHRPRLRKPPTVPSRDRVLTKPELKSIWSASFEMGPSRHASDFRPIDPVRAIDRPAARGMRDNSFGDLIDGNLWNQRVNKPSVRIG